MTSPAGASHSSPFSSLSLTYSGDKKFRTSFHTTSAGLKGSGRECFCFRFFFWGTKRDLTGASSGEGVGRLEGGWRGGEEGPGMVNMMRWLESSLESSNGTDRWLIRRLNVLGRICMGLSLKSDHGRDSLWVRLYKGGINSERLKAA